MQTTRLPRNGYNLLELLVGLSIVAVIFGMVLSAIQTIRLSALRTQNQNHIRQIILAVHQMADNEQSQINKLSPAQRPFPPKPVFANEALFYRLLPIVHAPLPKSRDGMSTQESLDAFSPRVAIYRNPADFTFDYGENFRDLRTKVSYAWNMVAIERNINFTNKYRDGLSQTIALSDKLCLSDGSNYRLGQYLSTANDYRYVFDPRPGECYGERRATFADKGWNDVLPVTDSRGVTTPSIPGWTFQNPRIPEEVNPNVPSTPFRAGLTVAMFDGSVRTIAPNVSESVFWAQVTPAGGEVASIE